MRVSKTVKEYITKKVYEVYNPRIKQIDAEYTKKRQEIFDIIQSYIDNAEKEIKAIINNNSGEWNFTTSFDRNILGYTTSIGDYNAENKYRIKKNDLLKERDTKIEEIIVELELGGTKETLEKMLKNL